MPGTLSYVPIDAIIVKPQIREVVHDADLTALAESIRQHGVLVPLLGHLEDGEIVLDDGHRRLAAALIAGCPHVPIVVCDRAPSPSGRTTLQLLANAHRADLKVTEQARAIDQLMRQTGWPAAEVSARLGSPSPASISKLLTLLVLPRGVQDAIDAGRLPMSSAYAIATVADPAERDRLVGEVLGGRLTRDRLVKEVTGINRGGKQAGPKRPRARRERVVIPLGEGRSVAISAPALTVEEVANWLAKLAAKLRKAGEQGSTLAEAVQLVSVRGRGAPAAESEGSCSDA